MSDAYRPSARDRREGSPRFSINCPHCGSTSRVRTSRPLTSLVRTANLQCTNLDCGHTFAAQLAITHTISPSRLPNPDVVLPIAPPRAHAIPSNDNLGGSGVPLAAST
jgi:hypothetical protein